MGYNSSKASSELWAVVDEKGFVLWTGGGSSSTPKLAIYESEAKAKSQLSYIKRIYKNETITTKRVYKNE